MVIYIKTEINNEAYNEFVHVLVKSGNDVARIEPFNPVPVGGFLLHAFFEETSTSGTYKYYVLQILEAVARDKVIDFHVRKVYRIRRRRGGMFRSACYLNIPRKIFVGKDGSVSSELLLI